MPRAAAQVKKANLAKMAAEEQYNEDEAGRASDPSSDNMEDDGPHPSTSKGRKRGMAEDEEEDQGAGGDYGTEMQRMLECFGADIFKMRMAKRKRLETYTQNTLKTTNKRVDEIWRNQHAERQKLHDEFSRQVVGVFSQWESDVDKTKDQEEKLTNLFRQQQKLFQQTRIIQTQRLKTIKQLHEEYVKGLNNLEKCHGEQQTTVQGEMKKEMSLLQKKILMDTQQQEVASFKKSLQNMLY